ncbi:PqqD family protein [Qipengyuania sp. GH38]|uniref:PqqD family protein n=1 Tax=Qipengyuania intermedia TaxID=2867244 RepID=UPI001C867A90|nr:PqqD family protein [Qipengyuania intermedia]MBX7514030.1 PqqD family protein [Qipengyuania intermedia]
MSAIRKLTGNFIATEVGDEILLIDLDGGELFSLSGTARAIWEAIDGQRDTGAIAAVLAPGFDATAQVIERDASDLVRALEDARLVEKID